MAESSRWRGADWTALALVVLLACLVRVVFFTGAIGSDDIIYTEMAVAILHGDWTSWSYAGALRYGINLPVAGMIALLGRSEFTANLWALLCGIGEVTTVFVLAHHIWGRRAAVLSAVVLALLPLHVNLSGRLLADTPLTFFVTLCFAFFYFGERHRNRWFYLAAGLSLGAAYWVKESVPAIVVLVFLAYALVARTFRREWVWAIVGSTLMVLLNIGLMWWISGDPWLVFRAVDQSMDKLGVGAERQTSPAYYFRFLFLDGRHTWLMPYLAVAALWVWWRSSPVRDRDTGYIVLWGMGSLLIFSFAVVSLSPLVFIPKQTNYMLIFAAPFSLLAGYWLALNWKRRWMPIVLLLLIGGSLVLSALEQQVARVFVSNSRAALAFHDAHPGLPVFGSPQATRLSSMVSALDGQWPTRPGIRPLSELTSDEVARAAAGTGASTDRAVAYAIFDTETMNWGRTNRSGAGDVPGCWIKTGVLEPEGFGVGQPVLRMLRSGAAILLPSPLAQRAILRTDLYYRPLPAYVYEIPPGCRFQRNVF